MRCVELAAAPARALISLKYLRQLIVCKMHEDVWQPYVVMKYRQRCLLKSWLQTMTHVSDNAFCVHAADLQQSTCSSGKTSPCYGLRVQFLCKLEGQNSSKVVRALNLLFQLVACQSKSRTHSILVSMCMSVDTANA